MPEVNQYVLDHRELIETLIKHCGIHEGRWMLLVTFGFTGANVGLEEGVVHPTGLVSVQKIGLMRAEASSPPSLVVDAAKVNPASTQDED